MNNIEDSREDIMNDIKKIIKSIKSLNINNDFYKKIDAKTLAWFTDGSCQNNGHKNSNGGYAAICVSKNKQGTVIYGKVDDTIVKATNIRAEGTAILNVFKYSIKHIKESEWNKICIYTDSKFWVSMIYDYMPNWDDGNFDKKANPDLTKEIWKSFNTIKKNKDIEIIHVYAHNKDNSANSANPYKQFCNYNNDLADKLANISSTLDNYKINIKKITK